VSKRAVTKYIITNLFNFISNGDLRDPAIHKFVTEQQNFLQSHVKNITNATFAIKPAVKKERKPTDVFDKLSGYWGKFKDKMAGLFSFYSRDKAKDEHHDEVVEVIKIRMSQMFEEAPPSIKEELKEILHPRRENFYIEHSAK